MAYDKSKKVIIGSRKRKPHLMKNELKNIFKYSAGFTANMFISFYVPKSGELLKVANQNGMFTAWFVFDVLSGSFGKEKHEFILYFTGQPFTIEDGYRYVDTLMNDGLVYHVYYKDRG
jgi:hypothetical protein